MRDSLGDFRLDDSALNYLELQLKRDLQHDREQKREAMRKSYNSSEDSIQQIYESLKEKKPNRIESTPSEHSI